MIGHTASTSQYCHRLREENVVQNKVTKDYKPRKTFFLRSVDQIDVFFWSPIFAFRESSTA